MPTEDEDFAHSLDEIMVDKPVLLDVSQFGLVSCMEGVVARETPRQVLVAVAVLQNEIRFWRHDGSQVGGGSYRIATGDRLVELLKHRRKARLVSTMKQDWRADRQSVETMRMVADEGERLLRELGEWEPAESVQKLTAPSDTMKQSGDFALVDRIDQSIV